MHSEQCAVATKTRLSMKHRVVAPGNDFVDGVHLFPWERPPRARSDYHGAPSHPFRRPCSLCEAAFPGAVQYTLVVHKRQTAGTTVLAAELTLRSELRYSIR